MNRDDVNYWLSPKFDHVPPTDEELNYGRPITKSQLARSIGLEIKQILIREGSIPAAAEMRITQLARMVKDDEPEADDEEADAALNDAYAEGRKDEREASSAGRALTWEEALNLASLAIYEKDGRGMVNDGRRFLTDRVARAIFKAVNGTGEPQ